MFKHSKEIACWNLKIYITYKHGLSQYKNSLITCNIPFPKHRLKHIHFFKSFMSKCISIRAIVQKKSFIFLDIFRINSPNYLLLTQGRTCKLYRFSLKCFSNLSSSTFISNVPSNCMLPTIFLNGNSCM